MSFLTETKSGKEILVTGNEAIVRGALEAGVRFAAAYPGSPSSEILELLGNVADEIGLYAEWSANEKVALEAAAAAAMAGVRSITAMKQNGVNVASDALLNVNLTGVRAGFVVIICDDPGAISSGNEQDPRWFAKMGEIPLFEPAGHQELKDTVKCAFEISEEISCPVMVRSSTRLSHARGNMITGEIQFTKEIEKPKLLRPFITMPVQFTHNQLINKINKIEQITTIKSTFKFDRYEGPEKPDLIIVTCSTGYQYSHEAIELMKLKDRVGIYKVTTTNPLPRILTNDMLKKTNQFLVVEEVNPFLEESFQVLAAQSGLIDSSYKFFGKATGHIVSSGELNPNIVIDALNNILGTNYKSQPTDYAAKAVKYVKQNAPERQVTFCPGCPHRATYWSIQKAIRKDGRKAVVCGDIGCYTLGMLPAGYQTIDTLLGMGGGVGMANGFGQLGRFGFNQPVLAVAGDSTFFHSVIPALLNATHHETNFTVIVMDNSVTAMTGAQPHPGSIVNAMGKQAKSVSIVNICEALGAQVKVVDPFKIEETTEAIYDMMQIEKGLRVIIAQQPCALYKAKQDVEIAQFDMHVDTDKCIGKDCGCDLYCVSVFKCPGLILDKKSNKAIIDEVQCTGCGVCASICPNDAIIKEVK